MNMKNLNPEMILSASGWRKVFAVSGDETDSTSEIGKENTCISILASLVFSDYIKKRNSISKQRNKKRLPYHWYMQ